MADIKPRVDHLAIAFENLDWAVQALTKMGFTQKWHRDRIGDEATAMKTTVLEWGTVSFAMMEGIDGAIPSQITEYTRRYGSGILQHIAIEVEDLRQTVEELEGKGFK